MPHIFTLLIAFSCISAACSQARADECDAIVAGLAATIDGLVVGERTKTAGDFDVVELKQPAADKIRLMCSRRGSKVSDKIAVEWHSAYAPRQYFDVIATAGALVTLNSIGVVRKGALDCQRQVLSMESGKSDLDLAGVHFECSATLGPTGRIAITVSSNRDRIASELPPPDTLPRPRKHDKKQ
jgi:hypothetical protein